MPYLFLDNHAKAIVYNKQTYMPGGMTVDISTKLGGNTVVLAPFITGFSVSRQANADLRQALDGTFHLTSFGEAAGDVQVRGILVLNSQLAKNFSKGVLKTAAPPEVTLNEYPNPAVSELLLARDVRIPGEPEIPLPPEAEVEDGFLDKIRAVYEGALSDIADSKLLGVTSLLTSFAKGLAEVTGAIGAILSAPGALLNSVKQALGLQAKEVDLVEFLAEDHLLTTVQHMNAFFHACHAGTENAPAITVSTCGIDIVGYLMAMSFQPMPKVNTGYSFVMTLKATEFKDLSGNAASKYDEEHIADTFPSVLGQLIGNATQLGFSAIRSSGAAPTGII